MLALGLSVGIFLLFGLITLAAPASLTISNVQHAVARYFNKKVTELQARRRTKSILKRKRSS